MSTHKTKKKTHVQEISSISEEIDHHPYTMDVIVDNCHIKGVYVDGGTTCNIMVPRIMKKLNLSCNRKSITRIKVVEGRRFPTLGIIEDLLIFVNDITTIVNFYVMDIKDNGRSYPAILGHPWLQRSDAISY